MVSRFLHQFTTSVLTAVFQVNLGWLVAALAVFVQLCQKRTFVWGQLARVFLQAVGNNTGKQMKPGPDFRPVTRPDPVVERCETNPRQWLDSSIS